MVLQVPCSATVGGFSEEAGVPWSLGNHQWSGSGVLLSVPKGDRGKEEQC